MQQEVNAKPDATIADYIERWEASYGVGVGHATLARFDALHKWRKTQALQRGVESDVICPKEALWALARTVPGRLEDLSAIPGLGPWKRQAYGPALIELLSKFGK